MHYIAEYGVAAHWRYKEELGAEDPFLNQSVMWQRFNISWWVGALPWVCLLGSRGYCGCDCQSASLVMMRSEIRDGGRM